jgi:hypothetical protein
MTDASIFDVPVELSLELVVVARPHLSDTESEALDDVVEEVDGVGLGVSAVDLEGPDTGDVVDGGVLMMFDRFPVIFWKD